MIFLIGCAAKIPHVIVPDYDKRLTKLIVVMPVKNASEDPKAADMLRTNVIEELYFKGYPRIPGKVVDERLALGASGSESLTPQRIGELLNVDAVLFGTLHESKQGRGFLFASTVVEAEFELRSAKTGERLWRVQHRVSSRNFGFTSGRVALKSAQVYESVMQEVVSRALETLPDATGY
ncbi:MAG: DUF799 family lipoprotein [Deltaproteobacteria bacterium]|nr:DUF799 family lipoprotein [Deltaproteobacteria bacterium]